jgi:hypothetical protein
MELLYKGEKFMEMFQREIKIIFVNHEDFSCIEVIVFGVRLGNKTAKLYLNSSALVPKINGILFKSLFDEKRINAKKLHLPFESGFDMKKIALSMITIMLVNALTITPSVFIYEFDLSIELNGECGLRENNDVEYSVKPPGLVMFNVNLDLFK